MKTKLGGQFFDATFRCDKGGPKCVITTDRRLHSDSIHFGCRTDDVRKTENGNRG